MRKAKQPKMQIRRKLTTRQKWNLVFWTIGILIWVGASIIVAQLVVGKIMLLILGRETFIQAIPTAIYSALSYALAMFLIIYVPAKTTIKWNAVSKKKNSKKIVIEHLSVKTKKVEIDRNELGLRGLPTWTDIGLAPVGLIVALLLAAGLTWVFGLFPWFDASEAQEVGFSLYAAGLDRVIAFVTLVVVAPIAEEVIFRGWLYGKLREKMSESMSEAASIVISSLLVSVLFGTIHMQWNVGLNVFALSLVMCGLREVTGTIYAGILLHMLKNGLAFYLLYVIGI